MRTTMTLAALLLTGVTQAAAQGTAGHGAMAMAPAAGPSMMQSMDKMNQAMTTAPMTGNPDHDFVVMMIPHHQGAIDMARYELDHGNDPALRKLARGVVAAQEKEAAFMKRWLEQHPAK